LTSILIVDDKAENLYMLRTLLEGYDFTVGEARHGAEALKKARQSPPDLIISDLLMPLMDGYELLRQWKGDEQLRTIPFVVYTATYTDSKDERLALDLGADAFMVKPLEPEPFMKRIQEVLEKKALGEIPASGSPRSPEDGLFKKYSEVLVNKLEEKVLQLEEVNRSLHEEIGRRQRTEVALVQSRRDWENIFQAIGHPTIIMDVEHGIVSANKAAIEVSGKSINELLGTKCYEIFHSNNAPPNCCPMESLLESGSTGTVEMEMEALGSYFLVSCTPIFDEQGKLRRVIHIATDISDRKHAEEVLRESEDRYRLLAENTLDVIWQMDLELRFTYVNPAIVRLPKNCGQVNPAIVLLRDAGLPWKRLNRRKSSAARSSTVSKYRLCVVIRLTLRQTYSVALSFGEYFGRKCSLILSEFVSTHFRTLGAL
jgi:PAS domain S-box-containing protein